MSIQTIVDMVKDGQWAAIALLVLTLLNVLLSKESAFPITVPAWLRPLLVILAGQGLAVAVAAAAHQPYILVAVHAGLASIVAIATSHAIWNGNAPAWMKSLAGLAQAIEEVVPAKSAEKKEEDKQDEKAPEGETK